MDAANLPRNASRVFGPLQARGRGLVGRLDVMERSACVRVRAWVCVCVSNSVSGGPLCRGTGADLPIQSNEAMAFRWMSGLINHLYLH